MNDSSGQTVASIGSTRHSAFIQTKPPQALRLCYIQAEGEPKSKVSCSDPHSAEWVGLRAVERNASERATPDDRPECQALVRQVSGIDVARYPDQVKVTIALTPYDQRVDTGGNLIVKYALSCEIIAVDLRKLTGSILDYHGGPLPVS